MTELGSRGGERFVENGHLVGMNTKCADKSQALRLFYGSPEFLKITEVSNRGREALWQYAGTATGK